MKTIQTKQTDFQKFYASEFMTLLFFAITFEMFILVIVIFGGGK